MGKNIANNQKNKKIKAKTLKNKDAASYRSSTSDFIGEDNTIFDKPIPKRSAKEYFMRNRQRFENMDYQEKIVAHKRMVAARILYGIAAVAIILVLFFTIRYFIIYSDYRVVDKETRSAGTSVRYAEFYGKVLRYSKDGATFYDRKDKYIWNETYEMQNPIIDICGKSMVIADQNGNKVCVFDLEGKKSSFEVGMPIKKVQVSEKGTLVLLLENDGEHYIQYLDSKGNIIAEGKSVFEKRGYPLDIALSDDGLKLAVSYFVLEDGVQKTNIVFYSFASIGASEIDNIVSSEKFDNTVVPTICYADSKTAFAFGDDRLVIFKGTQRPKVSKEIVLKEDVESIFYDEDYAGMVFKTEDGYRMDVYDIDGDQILSKEFDFDYDSIKISKERIVMYNDEEWCIYTMKGRLKLAPCELSGSVSDIEVLSSNKYLLVKANKTETVKLSL